MLWNRYLPLEKDDWVKFEKANSTNAFNMLNEKGKEICSVTFSKIVLLTIPNRKGCHYLALIKLPITSKHQDDFHSLSCFHSFRTENKLKSYEKLCKNNLFV